MCDFCKDIEQKFPDVDLGESAQYNVIQDRHYKRVTIDEHENSSSILIVFPNEHAAFKFAGKLWRHHFTLTGTEVLADINLIQLFQEFDWLFHMACPVLIDGQSGYSLRHEYHL